MSNPLTEGTPLTYAGDVSAGNTGTFTLPLLGRFAVESVVAHVTNGGAPSELLLELMDKSGAVIAAVPIEEELPAGNTGILTWAWRLAASQAAASGFTPLEEVVSGGGIAPTVGNFSSFAVVHNSGASLLDLSTPTQPKIVTAGLYALTFPIICNPSPIPPGQDARVYFGFPVVLTGFESFVAQGGSLQGPSSHTLSLVGFLPANQRLDVTVSNDSLSPARTFTLAGARVVRLA